MSVNRGNVIASVLCAVVILGSLVILITGDDPPLEETRLGENTTTTTTSRSTAVSPGGDELVEADLDAVDVELEEVAQFDQPIASGVRAGETGIYVAERGGRVWLLKGSDKLGPLVDISADTEASGERGLLGMTFAPEGDVLYLHFTDLDGTTQIDEFAVDASGAVDAATRRNVLSVEQPFSNHNGGHIAFGPDGFLYVALGDGGSGGDPEGNGQNTETLLGSILRIDPLDPAGGPYAIPESNPFVSGGGAPEVFISGLRNPWRFDFDDDTGDLWIGDVGQNEFEEVTFLVAGDSQAGANLGWNVFEGDSVFAEPEIDGTVKPVLTYGRGEGTSITGGVVYRGSAIPDLIGAYLYADFFAGEINAVTLDRTDCPADCGTPPIAQERDLGVAVENLGHFAEGPDGEVYVFSLNGSVSKLVPA